MQGADLSKLKGILGTSLKVMKKEDEVNPIVLSETTKKSGGLDDDRLPMSERSQASNTNVEIGDYSDEQIEMSNLPESVKKIMREQRIARPTQKRLTKADLYDENDEKEMNFDRIPTPKKLTETRKPAQQTLQPQYQQKTSGDLITVSKQDLDQMINNKLIEHLVANYTNKITEDVIAKTMNKLIREGKIAIKKK